MMDMDAYVGLPWADRGRSIDGCDCYGLIVLVYRGMLGTELASLSDRYATAEDRQAIDAVIACARDEWEPIAAGAERPFDTLLLRGAPWHIGMVARPGWMLHMPEGKTSVIEQYTTGRYARRVEGIYRHASQGNRS